MSYDWTPERYRRRQPTCWDPPWTRRTTAYQHSSSYELDMYSPSPPRRRPTCWDPPVYRETPSFQPYDPPRSRQPSCWDPPPRRASRGYSDYDQDQPGQRIDRCRPPSYIGPDSDLQPQYQPRSATKAEDPISAKLDRILEAFDRMETWVGATNRRLSKLRSSPHPEPDRHQPNVSAPLRKMAYPPSRNNEASLGPSGLSPNDSSAPPGHLCSAAPPPAAAAPPPLLHVDQQPSPSCCHPTTHLRQAGAGLELPTTVQQPLLQRSPPLPLPRSDHPPQPSPAPPLELLPYSAPRPSPPLHPLSVTVPLLVSNGHSQAVPSSRKKEWQTNLHNVDEYGLLKVVPCLLDVVVEEGIVEDKLKENGIGSKGLIGSKDDEASDIFKMIKMTIVRAFDPGICVNFSKHRREFLAMQMEKMDLSDSKKELPHEGVIKCLFAIETFRIEPHMPAKKFNWYDEGKRSAVRFAFDPGGDVSQQFLAFNSHRCFVVPTLRTRWISTVGELIRSYLPVI